MKKALLSGVALLVCTSVMADDIFPAQWRGQWSTTYQYWNFSTSNGAEPTVPDGPELDVGQGIPGIPYEDQGGTAGYLPGTFADPNPGAPWIDVHDSGRQGIFPLSGSIDVTVENHEPRNPYKIVHLQITWMQQEPGGNGAPAIVNLDPVADPAWPVSVVDEYDHGDGFTTSLYEWRIYPNPELESFTIGFDNSGVSIDDVIIDTWCIPEPSSVALVGIVSGLGLFVRRRFI